MNLAFGVASLWLGAALLYIGVHGLEAATPWGAFMALIAKMREETGSGEGIGKQVPRAAA